VVTLVIRPWWSVYKGWGFFHKNFTKAGIVLNTAGRHRFGAMLQPVTQATCLGNDQPSKFGNVFVVIAVLNTSCVILKLLGIEKLMGILLKPILSMLASVREATIWLIVVSH